MLLVATDPVFREHDPGPGHPERVSRLAAVDAALAVLGVTDDQVLEPRDASHDELARVHRVDLIATMERLAAAGGGRIDADTSLSSGSFAAARRAAGAGLAAVDALRAGAGEVAFCAVRPPGHHATATRSMGFCLFNNVAVTAAALVAAGERVLVVDWDAHHGNGTQDIFYANPNVLYVSMHEWPLYPGTGALAETGAGPAEGTTVNFPLPAGATGDVYLAAVDEVVGAVAERFAPDWLLVSAGFDAHRADPLTGLGLAAGDYADLTRRLLELVPRGRTVLFLEGGYDLDALRDSVAATLAAAVGEHHRPERSTAGGPGHHVVTAAKDLHAAT